MFLLSVLYTVSGYEFQLFYGFSQFQGRTEIKTANKKTLMRINQQLKINIQPFSSHSSFQVASCHVAKPLSQTEKERMDQQSRISQHGADGIAQHCLAWNGTEQRFSPGNLQLLFCFVSFFRLTRKRSSSKFTNTNFLITNSGQHLENKTQLQRG